MYKCTYPSQIEEKEMHHQRQLQQIQAQIRQQQQQLQSGGGSLPGVNPNVYGMLRPDQLRNAVTNQAGASRQGAMGQSGSKSLHEALTKKWRYSKICQLKVHTAIFLDENGIDFVTSVSDILGDFDVSQDLQIGI